ncbi:MAG: stage V sporulation protein AC [Ruminococcus sp.]|nr:stage V sporulation protein AC [Ruminococcus sp.]
MKVSRELYSDMQNQVAPKSKSYKNIPLAFVIGGLICVIGQLLISMFMSFDFEQKEASAWASIILVGASALFTGLGLYEKIAKHAGAGTLVPITGFANSISSSALEFKSEGFILGVGAKIFTIAGPVILYGTTASIIFGLIYYFIR